MASGYVCILCYVCILLILPRARYAQEEKSSLQSVKAVPDMHSGRTDFQATPQLQIISAPSNLPVPNVMVAKEISPVTTNFLSNNARGLRCRNRIGSKDSSDSCSDLLFTHGERLSPDLSQS